MIRLKRDRPRLRDALRCLLLVAVVNGTAGRVDEAQHAALVCERADERLRRAHEYLGHWPPPQWSAAECRPAADSNE